MTVLAVLVWLGAVHLEAFEWVAGWSARHEEREVDELVVVVALLAVAYGVRGHLRGRRLVSEVARRSRVERQLTRVSAAVEAATDAVAIADARGRILYANAAQATMYGYDDPEELVGQDWTVLVHPDGSEREREEEVGRQLLGTGQWRGNVRRLRRDGSQFSAFLSLSRTADGDVVSVSRDLTEEERAQQAVARREERYGLAAAAAGDVIVDVDLDTGRVLLLGATAPLLGLPGGSHVTDRSWWLGAVHPDDVETVGAGVADLVAQEGGVTRMEYRLRRADGTYVPVLDRAFLVRDPAGRPTRVVGSLMDMTERIRHEADLERARREAQEASRAKSEFLANMSHEIRTPMNGVIGMVEMLLSTELSQTQRRYATTVRRSGERLLHIINDILDFSKIEARRMTLEVAPVDLRSLVAECLATVEPDAGAKGVALRSEVAADLWEPVLTDRVRLAQILTNLLGNAVKFTDRGTVSLEVRRREVLGAGGGDPWVELTVTDTGVGIQQELTERLFDAFTQADESVNRRYIGTGLGLSISRQLAELMGGTITVSSGVGTGSVFRVALPLRPAQAAGASPDPSEPGTVSPEDAPPGEGRRVLLAEDDEVNQEVALLMLRRLGYQVDVAGDGVEAVEAWGAESYDAVLMDVHMPVLDGLAATSRIREQEEERATATGDRTPIIAMTASARQEDRDRAEQAGMDGFLTKPVRLDELARALGESIGGGAPAPAASELLDERTVRTLVSMEGRGSSGFLGDLVREFEVGAAHGVTDLVESLGQGDGERAAGIVRELRESATLVGAAALAGRVDEVGRATVTGDLAAALRLAVVLPGLVEESATRLRSTAEPGTDRTPSEDADATGHR